MDKKAIEVYQHYKSLYGPMLLLFRVRNDYEAYLEDAVRISEILGFQLFTETVGGVVFNKVALPSSDILGLVGKLSECGTTCKLIQARDSDGEFGLPDLQRAKMEQEMDY